MYQLPGKHTQSFFPLLFSNYPCRGHYRAWISDIMKDYSSNNIHDVVKQVNRGLTASYQTTFESGRPNFALHSACTRSPCSTSFKESKGRRVRTPNTLPGTWRIDSFSGCYFLVLPAPLFWQYGSWEERAALRQKLYECLREAFHAEHFKMNSTTMRTSCT